MSTEEIEKTCVCKSSKSYVFLESKGRPKSSFTVPFMIGGTHAKPSMYSTWHLHRMRVQVFTSKGLILGTLVTTEEGEESGDSEKQENK